MAWQLVTIAAVAVLTPMATLWATAWATAFGTRATRCGTALAITAVVETGIAALLLTTATLATTFTATIPLAFKSGGALALKPWHA